MKKVPWNNQACARCGVSAECHSPSNGACKKFVWSDKNFDEATIYNSQPRCRFCGARNP